MSENPYASPRSQDTPRSLRAAPSITPDPARRYFLPLLGGWLTTMVGTAFGASIGLRLAEAWEPTGAGTAYAAFCVALVLGLAIGCGKLAAAAYQRAYVRIVTAFRG